jgi:hypothetical protein
MYGIGQPSNEQLAKGGFFLGLALVVLGAVGELATTAGVLPVAARTRALFFDMEVLGVVLFLFSPIVFAIVLPLLSGN